MNSKDFYGQLSSNDIELILYPFFGRRGQIIACTPRTTKKSYSTNVNKPGEYKRSLAYQLSVINLAIGRYCFPQYSSQSAQVQAKAFIMVYKRIKLSDDMYDEFIQELIDDLLKDSTAFAASNYTTHKDIFFLSLDIYSLYVFVMKIKEGVKHGINSVSDISNDMYLKNIYIENFVPSGFLRYENEMLWSRFGNSSNFSRFQSSFLKLIDSQPVRHSFVMLNEHKSFSNQEIIDNAKDGTASNNNRSALFYTVGYFMLFLRLCSNYLEPELSVSFLFMSAITLLCVKNIIFSAFKFNHLGGGDREEMIGQAQLFFSSYEDLNLTDSNMYAMCLIKDILTGYYYLSFSLPFFYIIKTMELLLREYPLEAFDKVTEIVSAQKVIIRSKADKPDKPEPTLASLGLAKAPPDAGQLPGNNAEPMPLRKDGCRRTKKESKSSGLLRPLTKTSSVTEEESLIIRWTVDGKEYAFAESPIDQRKLREDGVNTEVFAIHKNHNVMFYSAFAPNNYSDPSLDKAASVLGRGQLVTSGQGVKVLDKNTHEIKFHGATHGSARFLNEGCPVMDDAKEWGLRLFSPDRKNHKEIKRKFKLLHKKPPRL